MANLGGLQGRTTAKVGSVGMQPTLGGWNLSRPGTPAAEPAMDRRQQSLPDVGRSSCTNSTVRGRS